MGWAFVRRRMAAELGPTGRVKFREFPARSLRAASLGQVHAATDIDGREGCEQTAVSGYGLVVSADLNQLKLAFSVYRRYDPAIDPSQIHAELAERLTEELDYLREARTTRLYGAMLADETGCSCARSD